MIFKGKITSVYYHPYMPARVTLSGHLNNTGCIISIRVKKEEAVKLVNLAGLDRDEIQVQIGNGNI